MYENRQADTKKRPTTASLLFIEIYRSNKAAYTKHFQMCWNSKNTYNLEYSMQNTYWSSENYRVTTLNYMENASLDLSFSSTRNREKCICIPLLGFYCFISWSRLPPAEGGRLTIPVGKARVIPLETLRLQHYTCGLLPPDFLLGGRH